jgi:hypothetical protein
MEKKTRSPRYPQLSLREAIGKIKMVYEKEHTHKAERAVIATDMGYAGLNGASAAVIASLRQYGLLERSGEAMRVSEDATTILELPPGDDQRSMAMERIAFSPPLFAELNAAFGSKLPSDENLRLYLVKSGFNRNAANTLIRTYRDTLSLVKEEVEGYDAETETEDTSQETSRAMQHLRSAPQVEQSHLGNVSENLQYRLTDDCKVRVLFEGSVSQEAVSKLIAYLNLGIDAFPNKKAKDE